MNEIKAHEIVLEMLPDCGQEKLYKQIVLCKFENHDVSCSCRISDSRLYDYLIRFLRSNLTGYLSSDRGLKQKIHALNVQSRRHYIFKDGVSKWQRENQKPLFN